MKYVSILILVLTTFLAGCNAEQQPRVEEEAATSEKPETTNETEKEESTEPVQEEEENEVEEEKEDEEKKEITLVDYRPEVGTVKKFYDEQGLVYTETIVAENEQYLQRVLELGNAKTVQILMWTDEEIKVVFESNDQTMVEENILENFTTQEDSEILYSVNGTDTLDVLDTNAKVEVPYGSFDKVYVVKKSTDEVAEADSFHTIYIAPGMGIIKEIYEVTGDQGYIVETVLKEVE